MTICHFKGLSSQSHFIIILPENLLFRGKVMRIILQGNVVYFKFFFFLFLLILFLLVFGSISRNSRNLHVREWLLLCKMFRINQSLWCFLFDLWRYIFIILFRGIIIWLLFRGLSKKLRLITYDSISRRNIFRVLLSGFNYTMSHSLCSWLLLNNIQINISIRLILTASTCKLELILEYLLPCWLLLLLLLIWGYGATWFTLNRLCVIKCSLLTWLRKGYPFTCTTMGIKQTGIIMRESRIHCVWSFRKIYFTAMGICLLVSRICYLFVLLLSIIT